MREVLSEMINFGLKEMKLHRIEAKVETEFSSYKKALKAFNLNHEGTKRK